MITELKETYNRITGKSLINNSQLAPFNLLLDSDKNKFFNLFRSFKMSNLDITYFIIHESDGRERWDSLSYQYYNTPYLWWTIPLVNKIENPFEIPEVGTNVKILKQDYVYNLLLEMKK